MKIKVDEMARLAVETLECPLCKERKFAVNSCITAKFPIDEQNNHCAGNVIPVLEFTCTNCANVISLNADILAQKVINSK